MKTTTLTNKPLSLCNIQQLLTKDVDVELYAQLESTNNCLLDQADKTQKVKICIADRQTKGRGRRGRDWLSSKGNISYSLLWPNFPVEKIGGLNMVIAFSVVNALLAFGENSSFALKWPNDILYKGEKLAGILIEGKKDSKGRYHLVIGVGINYFLSKSDKLAIGQPTASLFDIFKTLPDRNVLVACLITKLIDALDNYLCHGVDAYRQFWDKIDFLKNKKVAIIQEDKESFECVALGVDSLGRLRVLKAGNQEIIMDSASVQLNVNT